MGFLDGRVTVELVGVSGKTVDVTDGGEGEIRFAAGEPSSAAFDHREVSGVVESWETAAVISSGGDTLLSSIAIDHTSRSFESFTRSVWAPKRELAEPVVWKLTPLAKAWDQIWDGVNERASIGIHPKAGSWSDSAFLTDEFETGDMWSDPLDKISAYVAWSEHGTSLYAAPIGQYLDGGTIPATWFTPDTRDLTGNDGSSRITQLRIRYGQDLTKQATFPRDTPSPLLQATVDYPELDSFEQVEALADSVLPQLSAASSPAAALNQRVIAPAAVPWDALKPGFRYWDAITKNYAVLNELVIKISNGTVTEVTAEWERPGLALIKKRLPSN